MKEHIRDSRAKKVTETKISLGKFSSRSYQADETMREQQKINNLSDPI